MGIWELAVTIGSLLAATAGFIFVALRLGSAPSAKSATYEDRAQTDVEHLFNDEFREELRNRGRLHFEKIISENAMFLQQDLRLTTSQLNEYMKNEVTRKLEEEFAGYQQSIDDAKEIAIDSITKTREAIEQQRQVMIQQLNKEIAEHKNHVINEFEKNMADVINHYVLSAIGTQIDLNDQLEYILAEIEANKKSIMEDINRGT